MAVRYPSLVAILLAATTGLQPAHACSCSSALPGGSSEVSSVSGTAALFAGQGRFLVQSGLSLREVTDSTVSVIDRSEIR
jgi:hypothetical protein